MFLGIDIGSSSSKAAIIDENRELKAVSIINLGTGTNAYQEVVEDAMKQAGITRDDIDVYKRQNGRRAETFYSCTAGRYDD